MSRKQSDAPAVGALDRRLVLEYAQRTPDGSGGVSTTWRALADVWAHIETSHGAEAEEHGGIKASLVHDIRVRARPEIVPSRRFRDGRRIYEIVAVMALDERREFLRCRCSERNL